MDLSTASHKEINSFVVFDLETTGLPDYNFNKANITELAMHGFPADAIADGNRRLNHSLNLVFNPRMIIHPGAEKITGLNNYMLEHESAFNENAADIIINFLKHLRQPVCLVAHNGDKFDFPILKAAIEKLKTKEIPSDVLCLDSYTVIRMLDEQQKENKTTLHNDSLSDNADFKLNTIPFLNDDDTSSNIPNSTTDTTPVEVPTDDFKKPDHTLENLNTENITKEVEEDDGEVDWQKINETTPKQGIKRTQKLSRKIKFESDHPYKKPIPRSLDFTTPTKATTLSNPPPGFYKLENIYIRLFGKKPTETHQAEADVIVLKEIMFEYGDSFVKLANEKASLFSSVQSLGKRPNTKESATATS